MIFEPRQEAIWIKSVPARHKNCFFPNFELIHANRTSWVLHLSITCLFAVLFLNFNDRKSSHTRFLSWPLLFSLSLKTCLLHVSNQVFEHIGGSEILTKVRSKHILIYIGERSAHKRRLAKLGRKLTKNLVHLVFHHAKSLIKRRPKLPTLIVEKALQAELVKYRTSRVLLLPLVSILVLTLPLSTS